MRAAADQHRSAPAPAAPTTAPAPSSVAAPLPSPSAAAALVAVAGASIALVSMTDALRVDPASLTIAKGTTVNWRSNNADAPLPSGAQAWDSGNINPGQTPHVQYFCLAHELGA